MQSRLEGAIVNGGFEDDLITGTVAEAPLTGWTISQSVGVNEVIGRDTTTLYALAPHAGSIAAAYFSATGATGSGSSLTQTLTTIATSTYDVSLWVANPLQQTGNVNNVFSVSWDNQLITLANPNLTETSPGAKTYVVSSDTNWFQLLISNLPVTGTSTNLTISARNNDWATLVDDVIVAETPEPTTVVMLCVGATLMGMRRRRQRRL